MMQFAEEAIQRMLEIISIHGNTENVGIRLKAEKSEDQLTYQIFWEDEELQDDFITYQKGLKVFIDKKSYVLIENTYVFLTEQDGKEGLFIMNNTSNCSTCTETCF